MPARVPEIIRDDVFKSWLGGDSFRTIAIKHGVSEGSVNNIIAEKKLLHGSDQLDHYRQLGVAMSKSGLTVEECAEGHRICMILRNMGTEEKYFEGFISKIVKLYVNAGLGPENLPKQIDELYYFLERNQNLSGTASIPQICNDFKMKQAEKESLENEIAALELKKRDSQKEISAIQTQRINEEAELGLTSEYKEKLRVSGLSKDELPHCIDLGLLVKKCGYSVHELTERLSTMAKLEDLLVSLSIKNTQEELRNSQLVHQNSDLEQINSKHSLRLRQLLTLDKMGFGFPELKQLCNILCEIAEARGMSTDEKAVVKWFFDSVRDHLYDYVDLGKTVEELHARRDDQLAALSLTPDVKIAVDSLLSTGIQKDDIKRIIMSIEQIHLASSKSESGKDRDGVNRVVFGRQPTISPGRAEAKENDKSQSSSTPKSQMRCDKQVEKVGDQQSESRIFSDEPDVLIPGVHIPLDCAPPPDLCQRKLPASLNPRRSNQILYRKWKQVKKLYQESDRRGQYHLDRPSKEPDVTATDLRKFRLFKNSNWY